MTEHKHAEVLRAIADGKEVEYLNPEYGTWNPPKFEITPLTYPHLTWRIKPESKPPIVVEARFIWSDDEAFWEVKSPENNIRFTFDPDTKLPIKVELI